VNRRLSEISYLSNLLIAGSLLDGTRFQANDAAKLVMATCNLALDKNFVIVLRVTLLVE
jgi:hypothetical protein